MLYEVITRNFVYWLRNTVRDNRFRLCFINTHLCKSFMDSYNFV